MWRTSSQGPAGSHAKCDLWDGRLESGSDFMASSMISLVLASSVISSRTRRRGSFLSAMLAPPCGSFSAINRFAGRTHADVWANNASHKTAYMAESVRVGNKCMRAALRLIRVFKRHRVPWILGHPLTSRAWWIPALKRLRDLPHGNFLVLDQCRIRNIGR